MSRRRMNQNNTTQKSASVRRRRRSNSRLGSANPPQMLSNVVLQHKFRYLSSGSFSGTIASNQILNSLGVVCTVVNTTAVTLFKSFRLTSVEIWSPPASQGAASTISIEWLGSGNSPSKEYSDTTLSVSRNAHIRCSPPKQSLASFWQNGGTTVNYFTLNVPAATVIDLHYEYIEQDDEAAPSTVAIATGVLGNTYYLALDHGTSDLLVPVRLTTTV